MMGEVVMARILKSGIDYFPLDVTMNEKIQLIEVQFGYAAFAMIVKLYQQIYSGHGYYCEWTEESSMLFCDKHKFEREVAEGIINAALKRGLFCIEKYKKYSVLTSEGIQSRYLEAIKRRKEIALRAELLLVDPALLCENVNIKFLAQENCLQDVNNFKQRKEKKSKVNKRKEDRQGGFSNHKFAQNIPTLKEVTDYCLQRKSSVNPNEFYEYFNVAGWTDSRGQPVNSWKQKIVIWEKYGSEQKPTANKNTNKPDAMRQNLSVPEFTKRRDG